MTASSTSPASPTPPRPPADPMRPTPPGGPFLRWLGSLPLVVRLGVLIVIVGLAAGYAWTAFGIRPSSGGELSQAAPEATIAIAANGSAAPNSWVPKQPGGSGRVAIAPSAPGVTPHPTPTPPANDPTSPNPQTSALIQVLGSGPKTGIETPAPTGQVPATQVEQTGPRVPAIMATAPPSARAVDVSIAHGSNGAGAPASTDDAARAQAGTMNPDAVRAVLLAAQQQRGGQGSVAQAAGDARTAEDGVYSSHRIQHPHSDYELHISDVIPAAFTRAVRSTQGGYVMALVTGDVCDHVHQRAVVIPGGASLIGHFSNDVRFGQNTLAVTWTELDYPNGDYLLLDDMPSEDKAGGSGVSASVNAHYGTKLQNTIIPGILAALLQSPSSGGQYGQSGNVIGSLRDAVGTNVVNIAAELATKAADQPDTLSIPGQTQFNAVVNRRVAFEKPYQGRVCGQPSTVRAAQAPAAP